jgi:hypothetical protein
MLFFNVYFNCRDIGGFLITAAFRKHWKKVATRNISGMVWQYRFFNQRKGGVFLVTAVAREVGGGGGARCVFCRVLYFNLSQDEPGCQAWKVVLPLTS